jgi:hypothetical protein
VIARGKVLEGADGVLPMTLFAGFLIRLDARAKTLELLPCAEGGVGEGSWRPGRISISWRLRPC